MIKLWKLNYKICTSCMYKKSVIKILQHNNFKATEAELLNADLLTHTSLRLQATTIDP